MIASEAAEKRVKITGDVLLAVGAIAYFGAFTSSFRQEIVQEWVEFATKEKIDCSHEFSLVTTLGDQVNFSSLLLSQNNINVYTLRLYTKQSTDGFMSNLYRICSAANC